MPLTGDVNPATALAQKAFFAQIARCVAKGNLVSLEGTKGLPEDFAAREPETDARFAFFAGEKNRCFLPLSYDEVTPGPRIGGAVAAIARWLHPAAFGRHADPD